MKLIIEVTGATIANAVAKAISFEKKSGIQLKTIQLVKDRGDFFGVKVKSSTHGDYVANIFARDENDVLTEFQRLDFPGRIVEISNKTYSANAIGHWKLPTVAEKLAAEKAEAEKLAAEKLAAEKAEAENLAAEKAEAVKTKSKGKK
jgi:hypothetical protein